MSPVKPLILSIGLAAGLLPGMAGAAGTPLASWSWDGLTKSGREQLPAGPWASWTPQQRGAASRAIYRCGIFGIMATGSGAGPSQDVKALASYMTDGCIYHTMPADWPGRAKLAHRIRTEFPDLHSRLPNLPDPQLDEQPPRRPSDLPVPP